MLITSSLANGHFCNYCAEFRSQVFLLAIDEIINLDSMVIIICYMLYLYNYECIWMFLSFQRRVRQWR